MWVDKYAPRTFGDLVTDGVRHPFLSASAQEMIENEQVRLTLDQAMGPDCLWKNNYQDGRGSQNVRFP